MIGPRAYHFRFGLRALLALVGLAGLFCMAVRSVFFAEPLGILLWPVILGFGADRLAGRAGISGGTIAGLLSFLMVYGVICSGPRPLTAGVADPWFLPSAMLFLGAGGCWGFYLSVWLYMGVETMLQQL
jgi:hypothetical protein